MLECTETITLVRHRKGEGDVYACEIVRHASWFEKTTIVTSSDGAKPANSFETRIFEAPAGGLPSPGDYCVLGEVEGVEKPADLKDRRYFRITSVGDNRRGGLPHIRISGS